LQHNLAAVTVDNLKAMLPAVKACGRYDGQVGTLHSCVNKPHDKTNKQTNEQANIQAHIHTHKEGERERERERKNLNYIKLLSKPGRLDTLTRWQTGGTMVKWAP
jgi:hypothetical protein